MRAGIPDKLREDALACLRAAVAAVEPRRLTAGFLKRHPKVVTGAAKVSLAAIGKAAAAMVRGAVDALGDRLDGGVVIVPAGQTGDVPPGFEVFGGGHPVPNAEGMAGARAIRRLADSLTGGDVLLCLISGGGSALMTLPPTGVDLADVQETTSALLRAGAEIDDLNCVRKHLDQLKGGRLARHAFPARAVALVLSDVIGDPLDVIASGPVTADPTTYDQAIAILRSHGIWAEVPAPVRETLTAGRDGRLPESPKPGDADIERAEAHVIGSNRMAAEAAVAEARRRGYDARLLTISLQGEARDAGRRLAEAGREVLREHRPVAPPACLIAAGETTVTVRGRGRGGRNQEVALGAALALEDAPGVLVASMGTDGIDGPTDAAGAVADGETLARARARGLDATRALADNDAYPFFAALDDLILTGPTGTNVMDVAVVMVGE